MYLVASPRLLAIACTFICASIYLPSHAQRVSINISDEAFSNNKAGRVAAAKLDDAWSSGFASGTFSPNLFAGGSGPNGSKTFKDESGLSYEVGWQFGYISDVGPGTPKSMEFKHVSKEKVSYSAAKVIRSKAPSPYDRETSVSSEYSSPGLNAMQLDFTKSETPITDFGIFVGDLVSRPNHGTLARIMVFDKSKNLIKGGDVPVIYSGRVQNGKNYLVREEKPSGPSKNDKGDWGDQTTSFISVSSSVPIGYVIIQTGDDDHTTDNIGESENFGVIGFQLPQQLLLPITLKSFDVDSRSDLVKVEWTTAFEENVDHFVVMRSKDGNAFYDIGTVRANSLGYADAKYSFQDFEPLIGNSYYKLIEVTIDNQRIDHGIRAAVFEGTAAFQMATYWSENQVAIHWLQDVGSSRRISIYTTSGEPVYSSVFVGSETSYLMIGDLPSGFYLVSILRVNGRSTTVKCFKP